MCTSRDVVVENPGFVGFPVDLIQQFNNNRTTINLMILKLKNVNCSDPTYKEWYIRFTMVLSTFFYDQECMRYSCFFLIEYFQRFSIDATYGISLQKQWLPKLLLCLEPGLLVYLTYLPELLLSLELESLVISTWTTINLEIESLAISTWTSVKPGARSTET